MVQWMVLGHLRQCHRGHRPQAIDLGVAEFLENMLNVQIKLWEILLLPPRLMLLVLEIYLPLP